MTDAVIISQEATMEATITKIVRYFDFCDGSRGPAWYLRSVQSFQVDASEATEEELGRGFIVEDVFTNCMS
jgi:hypothetical protein